MQIKNLFKKDINREIQGVIKIGQEDTENIHQELEEYVVTEEVENQLAVFFESYIKAYQRPTDRVGVWISGFFGSGKSHFLKIISYLLESQLEINGERAVSYFQDKIHNQTLLDNMKRVSQFQSEVVLFNIDSKADADAKQNKSDIVKVFNKVYNEMRGYSASTPWLAELEEILEKNGTYEAFQREFKTEAGISWVDGRDELYYNMDEAITALSKAADMSEDSARNWIENGEYNYSISVDSFAQRLKEYVDTKGDDFRLVFAADEVGQFVSGNVQLMLGLQTVVEDLGKYCGGKVWVIVTSQQDIDSLQEELSATDFSKIQGRFNTRVSLSSANADEVIKIRLLEKRESAFNSLTLTYEEHEAALKNKLEFEETATMNFYREAEDFARVYPFVPYQFNLLQKVFTSIREHGSAGKHLSDGERNLLESIQQATIKYQEEEVGQLIPFHTFYESIDQALEHSVRSTIINARKNEQLSDFDVDIVKLLFLVRYVDEVPGTLKNLTTLMISDIEEDTLELSKKINHSLVLLEREFLVQRIGNKYQFLTNEEQDVNRQIDRIQIPTSDLANEVGKRLIENTLDINKYIYKPFSDRPEIDYLIDISQWIDGRSLRNASVDIGVHFLTVYSDYTVDTEIIALSQRERKVIVQLSDEDFSDLRNHLQINQYLRSQSTKTKTPIVQEINNQKTMERGRLEAIINHSLESAIENATIYVNGYEVEVSGSPIKRIEEGLRTLVEDTYPRMNYIEKQYSRDRIEELIENQEISLLNSKYEDENEKATNEIELYLDMQEERNAAITLYDLMSRYEREPYGWKELDILASLIRLIKDEKITFTLNSRRMEVNEASFLNTIRKKDTQERIVVRKRRVLDSRIINTVRRTTNELFGRSHIGQKEEDMTDTVTVLFEKERDELRHLLLEYQSGWYPDEDSVQKAIKELDRLLGIKSSTEFLTYLANNSDDIIESIEDLEDVKDFFASNKKDIYTNAREKYDLYKEDQNYLDDSEIDSIMDEVDGVLRMARPYARIKDLNDLTDQFTRKLMDRLEDEMQPIKKTLEQDREDVEKELVEIKEFPEHETIQNRHEKKFEILTNKITTANSLNKLNSYRSESREIKITTIREIERAKQIISQRQKEQQRKLEEQAAKSTETPAEKTVPVVVEPEIKVENSRLVNKHDILPSQTVELRTAQDIRIYLKEVEEKLIETLQDYDVIKLT